jgi:hypothetical protein
VVGLEDSTHPTERPPGDDRIKGEGGVTNT